MRSECSVACAERRRRHVCNNATAAMLTPVPERLVAASSFVNATFLTLNSAHYQTPTPQPHNYSILITVKSHFKAAISQNEPALMAADCIPALANPLLLF